MRGVERKCGPPHTLAARTARVTRHPARALGLLLTLTAAAVFAVPSRAHAQSDDDTAPIVALERARRGSTVPALRADLGAQIGLALRRAGRPEEARAVLAESLADCPPDARRLRGTLQRRLASVTADLGELVEAEALLRDASRLHDGRPRSADWTITAITWAGTLKRLGRIDAARRIYRDAAVAARAAGEDRLERLSLLGLSGVVNRFGDFEWSAALCEQAEALCAPDDAACRGEAMAYRAAALALAGANDAARALVAQARPLAGADATRRRQLDLTEALAWLGDDDPTAVLATLAEHVDGPEPDELMAEVHFLRAEALLRRGWADEAEDAIDRGVAQLPAGALRRGRAPGLRASVARLRGDREAERRWLIDALEVLEAERRASPPDQRALFFAAVQRRQGFEAMLRLQLNRGDALGAAALIAHSKARAFSEQRLRDVHLDGATPEWSARDAFHTALAALDDPEPLGGASLDAIRHALPDHVALLDFVLLDDQVVIALVHAHAVDVVAVPVDRGQVGQHARSLLRALQRGTDDVDADAERQWLSQVLVEPIGPALARSGARWLGIIGHDVLHQLPFAVLDYEGGQILDRFAVFRGASAGDVALSLGTPALPPPIRVIALGDPAGDLPDGRAEARMVARRFTEGAAYVGPSVTEATARRALESADIVHFATHAEQAVPHRDAWLRLAPTPADDGRLTARELSALQVRARLVSLFGCDTAVGVPSPGDEVLGALDRSLLAAGARTVVSTHWPVDDAAALDLAHDFYRALAAGRPTVEALAEAQRALRDRSARCTVTPPTTSRTRCAPQRGVLPCGPPGLSGRHWAAFALVGDPR